MSTGEQTLTGERADLAETLGKHRNFVTYTARDLTDEQAATRTTASELTIGGIIKHLTAVERNWAQFITDGAQETGASWRDPAVIQAHLDGFKMLPDETLAGLISDYRAATAATDVLLASGPDLDASHALEEAPWNPPGARWSVRRVFLHLIAETSQHAGHADIIRESLDGAKTMG
jgi:hypothetical protein